MVFEKEFIWRKDHFAYHITKKEYMESIIKKGLIPQIGDRSKSVGDDIKGVFFFDCMEDYDFWLTVLYNAICEDELELLRFNLKNRKWFSRNKYIGDFYTPNIVLPNKIEYLELYNVDYGFTNSLLYLYDEGYEKRWKNISSYKK